MVAILNKERLPEEVQKKFGPYLEKMLEVHGGNLVSVVVYGSATGVNFIPKTSDINSAFIFKNVEFATLKQSLKIVDAGIKKRIAAPLFLTREYITSSLDVFPVEFLDMKENHVLVYGDDVLSTLDIKTEHLRLFCEQQIKGKLIRIRQAILEVGLKRKGMEAILKDSLNALIPIFRNLIRLKGDNPAVEKSQIVLQLSSQFGLDQDVFLPILRDKANDEKIAGQDVVVFLEKYLVQLEQLAAKVDQL